MVIYEIFGGHIRLRQMNGHRFEFAVSPDAEWPIRLSREPLWAEGRKPDNAEFLVYLAHAAAQRLAHDVGLIH